MNEAIPLVLLWARIFPQNCVLTTSTIVRERAITPRIVETSPQVTVVEISHVLDQ